MKLAVLLGAALALAGAVAGILMMRPRPKHSAPSRSSHGEGIDRQMASVRAALDAPLGANDCETAYNAFKASDDLAKSGNARPMVVKLAARDQFLIECNKLPAGTQACLAPRYLAGHREACKPLQLTPPQLMPMVILSLANQILPPPEAPPISE